MHHRTLSLVMGAGIFAHAATAQTVLLVCENWHPRLGQMNDLSLAIDAQRQTCNGNPCRIADAELSWSEGGGRYDYVVNRQSGEGQVRLYGASEPTAILKNCRAGDKKS